jgi:hypothetical protein
MVGRLPPSRGGCAQAAQPGEAPQQNHRATAAVQRSVDGGGSRLFCERSTGGGGAFPGIMSSREKKAGQERVTGALLLSHGVPAWREGKVVHVSGNGGYFRAVRCGVEGRTDTGTPLVSA